MKKPFRPAFLLPAFLFILASAAWAQPRNNNTISAADYARAEKMMSYATGPLVDRAGVNPNWLSNDRFWYRVLTPQGSEFILVDPAKGTRASAFNHKKLTGALTKATGVNYTLDRLPFQTVTFSPDDKVIQFAIGQKNWRYDLNTNKITPDLAPVAVNSPARPNEILAPDGKKAAFIRKDNLWLRDISTNKETALTTDGAPDFGYATDNAGWRKSDRPILLWSPDSRKIATYKQDQRQVSDMYLVTTNVGKPNLQSWKYPLAGDKAIITIQRVIIEVDKPQVISLQLPPDPRRGTLCDDISCGGTGFDDVEWNADASALAFVSTSRDHKQEKFRVANASTGAIREVFEETVATQYESGQGSINWRYLPASNEIIWYSERDNWGHLYLYDATTGKVKNQITKGDWLVTELVKVDTKNRLLYFLAVGREAGQNPYFSHLYRVGFDGKNLTPLSPEAGNHQITLSPSGSYFIDRYSQPDVPPVTVLRNLDGKLILNLEKADISRLTAAGWKPVTPITVKAQDGKTDLYGLLFTPTNLDPTKKYPIINYIYPGPQGGSVGSWSFAAARGDNQALAELGFVVVAIEGSCNPLRSKAFHDKCYGNMAENTLPDQIAGMQQLAHKYPFIDLTRVGIWGHSGGGYATATAMFRYPDFFKVGISESGNHDNRNYEDDWGERYIGLEKPLEGGKTNYEIQANQIYAQHLKGKLLLAHGLLDDNVPPYNTLLVVDALIKANKDFDLLMFPNSRHGYGEFSYYMTRRRWDYFVRHLLGATPPPEYELIAKPDPRNGVR